MKAQSAMETIILATVLLLMTVPAAFLIISVAKSSQHEIRQGQISKIGNDIISTSEKVYYQGTPSKITLEEAFPEGITNISTSSHGSFNELLFIMELDSKHSEISFPSKVKLEGNFGSGFSRGIKKVIIEAADGYVRISIK